MLISLAARNLAAGIKMGFSSQRSSSFPVLLVASIVTGTLIFAVITAGTAKWYLRRRDRMRMMKASNGTTAALMEEGGGLMGAAKQNPTVKPETTACGDDINAHGALPEVDDVVRGIKEWIDGCQAGSESSRVRSKLKQLPSGLLRAQAALQERPALARQAPVLELQKQLRQVLRLLREERRRPGLAQRLSRQLEDLERGLSEVLLLAGCLLQEAGERALGQLEDRSRGAS